MANKSITTTLTVAKNRISVIRRNDEEYICLTDLAVAKGGTEARVVVSHWMSNYFTIDFLAIWEELNNPNFNRTEFRTVRNEPGRFFMSPTKWVRLTNATGIFAKAGRYGGGIFAHKDIAFEFASWISPEFKLYLIKEFERLKKNEAYRNQIIWSVHREIAKTNYLIHTQAIKDNLVPKLTPKQQQFVYADEADLLNVVLFGMTAKQWREQNPDLTGNIRDYASDAQLKTLINLENTNAQLIKEGKGQKERLLVLHQLAVEQMAIFSRGERKKLELKVELNNENAN